MECTVTTLSYLNYSIKVTRKLSKPQKPITFEFQSTISKYIYISSY